jgi:hypothetical protein
MLKLLNTTAVFLKSNAISSMFNYDICIKEFSVLIFQSGPFNCAPLSPIYSLLLEEKGYILLNYLFEISFFKSKISEFLHFVQKTKQQLIIFYVSHQIRSVCIAAFQHSSQVLKFCHWHLGFILRQNC